MAASPRHPLGLLAITWMVHGVLLLFMAVLAAPLVRQTQQDMWLESMQLLGAWALVEPIQRALTVVLASRSALAIVGAFSLLVGILAMARPFWARWPLHGCAAVHLVLVPWAAWVSHAALSDLMPGMFGTALEILTVVAAEAGLVIAMVATERLRPLAAKDSTALTAT